MDYVAYWQILLQKLNGLFGYYQISLYNEELTPM